MTRYLLIPAAPTPWDLEDRIGGTHSLPLETDGEIAIREALKALPHTVTALYTYRGNEACEQAARLVSQRFDVRVRDVPLLEPVSLGLWQGLTRGELRFRYPTVFPQWEEDPLSVNPPEGEPVAHAIDRFRQALAKIHRRRRGTGQSDNAAVALVLRPLSLQIAAGLLRGEPPAALAAHLHDPPRTETIEAQDHALREQGK